MFECPEKSFNVDLNGSASSDPDGDTLDYEWTMTSWPLGSDATLSDTMIVNPTFIADMEGSYIVSLIVNDGQLYSLADEMNITVIDPLTPLSTLKKTGQTESYDQDGFLVTDDSIKDDGYYQIGVTPSYTRNDGSNVVKDNITGLEWQDNAAAATVTKQWTEASFYCEALPLDGGGWRLPNLRELKTLMDDTTYNPAINSVFDYAASDYYWSSTTFANVAYANHAWIVRFGGGKQFGNNKTDNLFVRRVRAGQ